MKLRSSKYGMIGECKKCGKTCTDLELEDTDEKEVGECYSCAIKERKE